MWVSCGLSCGSCGLSCGCPSHSTAGVARGRVRVTCGGSLPFDHRGREGSCEGHVRGSRSTAGGGGAHLRHHRATLIAHAHARLHLVAGVLLRLRRGGM
eukprot:4319185-Prymnesium_polylepis.1